MRRRLKKKRRIQGDVTLNLAAMLDMAFQLLAFFIITYHPPDVEGDIRLRLPPPVPTVVSADAQEAGSDVSNKNLVQGLNSLVITVLGSSDGSVRQIMFGEGTPIAGLSALETKLKATFADEALKFDQVVLQIGSSLDYNNVMQVIEICTRQKLANGDRLSKLSLVEAPQ
jgi:biopolymer transport protein ExbD